MAGIIYSKSAGLNDAKLGKLLTPLRVVIEHESDLCKKDDKILSALYNIETSNKMGETIQYQDEFGLFEYAPEGARAANDSLAETRKKYIEHIPFMKEFTITAEALEDSNSQLTPDMKRAAQMFSRAYYATRTHLGISAIANAADGKKMFKYGGREVDITTADELSLFNKNHLYGIKEGHGEGKQSNSLYSKRAAGAEISTEEVLEMLEAGAHQIRNMKDENGEIMGYTADTIIIAGNQRKLERAVKQALGSEYNPSDSTNAINTQYGNWNLIVLPQWQVKTADEYPILLMSTEANKNLCGNMFFNRKPLDVIDYIDEPTRNWNINGRCRFGLGFPTYKHIVRVKSVANGTSVSDADLI